MARNPFRSDRSGKVGGGRRRPARIVGSVVAGLVVADVPVALLLFSGARPFYDLRLEIVYLCLSVIAGCFVFSSTEKAEAGGRQGVAFAFGATLVAAALFTVKLVRTGGSGEAAPFIFVGVFFGVVFGLVGSGLAIGLSRWAAEENTLGRHRWLRPWRVGAAVGVLAVVFMIVTSVCQIGFVSGESAALPSALDSHAIDVKAAGAPAQLPSLQTGVPSNSVLEMTQWIAHPSGRELHSRRLIDYQQHLSRWDTYGDPAELRGGPTTTVTSAAGATILFAAVDDGKTETSFNAGRSTLLTGPSSPTAFGGSEDQGLQGETRRLGSQTLAGSKVDVYRIDLHVPSGQERTADFGLIYIDAASGLRVREEWLLGSPGHAWVYQLLEYQLLPRTDQLEATLKPEALKALLSSSG